jgi:hypothetical protein
MAERLPPHQRVSLLIAYVASAAAIKLHMRPDALDHCLPPIVRRAGASQFVDGGQDHPRSRRRWAKPPAQHLRQALTGQSLHNDMATFASAGVSDKGE